MSVELDSQISGSGSTTKTFWSRRRLHSHGRQCVQTLQHLHTRARLCLWLPKARNVIN